jgi:hypothetical protein
MTCASPSFRLSGKCPHATHSPSPSAHVQIPFMCCLGTLVLDRFASYSIHGIPLITRIHWSKVWRRATRKAVPERSGNTRQSHGAWHRAPESRSQFISDARCYTSKLRTMSGNTPLQPRSRTDRLCAILITWCRSVFTFLAHVFALPTHTSGNMPAFFGTGPPYGMRRSLGLGPFPSSAQPGDIFVGFARRRPPRPLCSTPPQESAAGGRG